MSKIYLIISAVLLLGTAGLGFLNKSKLTAKTEDIKKQMAIATDAQGKASAAQSKQKDAEKKLAESTAKATEMETRIAAADTEKKGLTDKIAENDKTIESLNADVIRLKTAAGEKVTGPVTIAAAPDTEAKLHEAETKLAELNTVNAELKSREQGLTAQVDKYRADEARRGKLALQPGLQGRILAVDRNWNFVVLSLGNRNGIVSGASMVVQRGGSLVGKVRITSVEPSQSIADIIPNSVPPGVSVQAGDTVIYPGGPNL